MTAELNLRLDLFEEEQPTFFPPGKDPRYQLDHVFADDATKQRVIDWRVDKAPVELDPPLSDHAPIVVDLESA